MKLTIDISQRHAKMRAHTAAHLLHAELIKIFPQTKQAWSFVDNDLLRFDFQTPRALTHEELKNVEEHINLQIFESYNVTIEEMSYQQALDKGAKAFFEDKYGDVVRVVSIGDDNHIFSQELCGGTHVARTDHIGAFSIVSQEAVASGIKRIVAVTWTQVAKIQKEKSDLLQILAEKIESPVNQLTEKLGKILKETQELKSQLESFQVQHIKNIFQNIISTPVMLGGSISLNYVIDVSVHSELKTYDLKTLTPIAQTLWKELSFLLYTQEGAYSISTAWISAKESCKSLGLKGGWNDLVVQGKDATILNLLKI